MSTWVQGVFKGSNTARAEPGRGPGPAEAGAGKIAPVTDCDKRNDFSDKSAVGAKVAPSGAAFGKAPRAAEKSRDSAIFEQIFGGKDGA